MTITLTDDQANAIMEYLLTRPAGEVLTAIGWIAQAKDDAKREEV